MTSVGQRSTFIFSATSGSLRALIFTGTKKSFIVCATLGKWKTFCSNFAHGRQSGVQKCTSSNRFWLLASSRAASKSCNHWISSEFADDVDIYQLLRTSTHAFLQGVKAER